jgi:hypothetical protein
MLILMFDSISIDEDSCGGIAACYKASDGIHIRAHSCNGGQTCLHLSGSSVSYLGSYSCNYNRAVSTEVYCCNDLMITQ